MCEIAWLIIIVLLSIILWLIIIQREEWKRNAYDKGMKDAEMMATDPEKYLEEKKKGRTGY